MTLGAGAASGARFRTRVETEIGGLDPERWDAVLHPDDLQASHRFVRACQEGQVEQALYRHVLIEDAIGPAATATVCMIRFRLDLLAPPALRRLGGVLPKDLIQLPIVIGGLPVSFNQSCLRVRRGVDPEPLVRRVEREAADLAADTGTGLLCFKELSDEELPVADPLRSMGFFRAASLPSCRLELPWRDFDAYVGSMRAGYRRQVRATLKAAREEGLELCSTTLASADRATLHRLYLEVMERAEYRMECLPAGFFDALARHFPEAEVLLAKWGNEVVAYALILHGPTRSTFLLTGIDYERNRRTHAYLRTVVEVVARCIQRGATSVELGQTSWDLKARLGARSTRRHLFLRHRSRGLHMALRGLGGLLFPEHSVGPRRVFKAPREPDRAPER